MGLRISRFAVAALVASWLAAPCATAAERPADHPVRTIAERVASWLADVGDRLAPAEPPAKHRKPPASEPDAFLDGPLEMGPTADPYG